MTDSILLREKPKLKFIFHEDGFEVVNEKEIERRTYVYEFINSFEFKKSPTNWFVTILSLIVDFFTGGATGGIYKDKNKEVFNIIYEDKSLKIELFNCDINTAKLIAHKINSKINSYTPKSY
ncbi:MAG: hypothetical protein COA67_06960 [Lutibacter sp.]|nr:MAG: hypothetical protein COA67_06960 [Lutibacter sp.]